MVTNNDTDAKKALDAVVNILKEYKKKAKTFTKADLDRYEFISDQQQDMLDSFSDDDGENSVGKKGTGSSVGGKKSSSKGGDSVKGIGKRLAAARKTNNTKNSYWK